jgi:hypothetical protein
MHHGCVRSRQRRPGGKRRVVADIAKLSVGREEYYTRELATDHQQYLSGHGESPGRWYGAGAPAASGCRAKHPWRGSKPCSRAATPRPGSCWAARMAATPSQPLMWSCGRPRACRSSTASLTQPLAGPCWPPIMPGWPRRSPTWTSTLGPAAAMAVSSTCPDRGCWRSGSTTGHPARAIRCCIPIWWWPTASRVRTDAGRPWTAAMSIGIGWPRMPSTGRLSA